LFFSSLGLALIDFIFIIDTNAALHFYSPENAVTSNGVLNITTERKVNNYKAFNEKTKKFYPDKKYIQSAMVQGWNKFCFTGGVVEFSAKLPGSYQIGGLWPARKWFNAYKV
jgi:beta-glucanase (GH16 family)